MAFVAHHTEVCTGVAEWEGDEPLSEEEEMERVAASRCKSSTFFCSSVRMARSSLRFWWIGTCQVNKEKVCFDSHSELSFSSSSSAAAFNNKEFDACEFQCVNI